MYFSRVTLRPGLPLHELARLAPGSPYDDHGFIWGLFQSQGGNGATRPFLFRRIDLPGGLRYFVVSLVEPSQGLPSFTVEVKPYDPQLVAGQVLRFSVRLNPVVSRRDEQGRQHRHDLVMDLKRSQRDGPAPDTEQPPVQELWNRAAQSWFEARGEELGLRVTRGSLVVEAYRQHGFTRRGAAPVRFSTLDVSGVLSVIDPERLRRALFAGIGPAKAFGCGLLLVRPA